MDLTLSVEQEELRRSVRAFLERTSPPAEVRRLMETVEGYDLTVWAQLSGQLGLTALAIPEEYGGSGYSFAEIAVVLEEMGRTLYCGPYFSSVVLAANAVLGSGDRTAMTELLPGIASGTTIAALAFSEKSARWDEGGVTLTATASGGGWTLNGQKVFVLDGYIADVIVTVARTPAGITLFAVDGDAAGLVRTPMVTMDQTRKQATLDYTGTPARLIGAEGAGWIAMVQVLNLAAAALAAEQVGGAQMCLQMSTDYAKTRAQFGRPIGSFQAIKHKCADMLLAVESAKSAAYYAAQTATESSDELPLAASMAKSYCSDAYVHAATENIHIHGGIGFTWEHPGHLYFKRAKTSQLLFGDASYHREHLAQLIGI